MGLQHNTFLLQRYLVTSPAGSYVHTSCVHVRWPSSATHVGPQDVQTHLKVLSGRAAVGTL